MWSIVGTRYSRPSEVRTLKGTNGVICKCLRMSPVIWRLRYACLCRKTSPPLGLDHKYRIRLVTAANRHSVSRLLFVGFGAHDGQMFWCGVSFWHGLEGSGHPVEQAEHTFLVSRAKSQGVGKGVVGQQVVTTSP